MDCREHSYYPDYIQEDTTRMCLVIDEDVAENGVLSYPAHFEVCPVCQGRGTHVNPSIDSHGLSREDFDEDPDFAEAYMSGAYDVPCNGCDGLRVILMPSTPEGKAFVEKSLHDEACYRAEVEAERRMGC